MNRLIAIFLIGAFVTALSACTRTTTYSANGLSSSPNLTSAEKKEREEDALETYIKLGLGYLREGNRNGARLHLVKALESNPRSAMANNGMALLYQLEKEDELAEEYYLKALRYDPGLTAARNNYAIFLLRKGRNEEAYKHLLDAAEDLSYPRRARVNLSLGQAASRLGNTDEALRAWEKSINIDPLMAPSYLELAKVYFERKDLPVAKQYLDKYDELVGPRAEALWLGVRLENAFGNNDGVASKGLALKKMFPYSQQNLDYQEWQKGQ